MNTKKIKQLWNCFLKKAWGFLTSWSPGQVLTVGSGSWEERDLGRGAETGGENAPVSRWTGTEYMPQSGFLDQIHRNNRGNKTSQTPKRTAYIAPFEEGGSLPRWETAGFQKRQKIDGKRFPGCPVAKTPSSQSRGPGFDPLVREQDPECHN